MEMWCSLGSKLNKNGKFILRLTYLRKHKSVNRRYKGKVCKQMKSKREVDEERERNMKMKTKLKLLPLRLSICAYVQNVLTYGWCVLCVCGILLLGTALIY